MEIELQIWKSKAEGYLQDYLDALKRMDKISADRDLWKAEATRWRDMYLQYDEMLEGQVQESVNKINKIWEDLNELKKKVEDEL